MKAAVPRRSAIQCVSPVLTLDAFVDWPLADCRALAAGRQLVASHAHFGCAQRRSSMQCMGHGLSQGTGSRAAASGRALAPWFRSELRFQAVDWGWAACVQGFWQQGGSWWPCTVQALRVSATAVLKVDPTPTHPQARPASVGYHGINVLCLSSNLMLPCLRWTHCPPTLFQHYLPPVAVVS